MVVCELLFVGSDIAFTSKAYLESKKNGEVMDFGGGQ
jgi:hypothetical protein